MNKNTRLRKEAEAAEAGKLKAQRKVPFLERLQDKLLEMVGRIDPLEAAAVLAGTIIVHEVIFNLDEFINSAKAWKDSDRIQTRIIAEQSAFGLPIGGFVLDFIALILPEEAKKTYGDKPQPISASLTGEVFNWLLAFCISYYAFKHRDSLLGVAKMFFGVGGVSPT